MIFKIALAQLNMTVGDLKGNAEKIVGAIDKSRKANASVVMFPELCITGYPPEDLLYKKQFVADNKIILKKVQDQTKDICAVVGYVDELNGNLYNAAGIFFNRQCLGIYRKIMLPNYGVFDEKRYFKKGTECTVFELFGRRIAVNICEDIWFKDGPGKKQSLDGECELMLNISASPYHAGKEQERVQMLSNRAMQYGCPIFYVNMVGGQDELVFDGGSVVVDVDGNVCARAGSFKEEILVVDLKDDGSLNGPKSPPMLEPDEEVYEALVLGTRDYVRKNNFQKVVIGLSGGIDSSLTSAVAVDALGSENVMGVFMPSQYSSEESRVDAEELAKNLGIAFHAVSIEQAFTEYKSALSGLFQEKPEDITEENLQARIRGNLLMALSNKFSSLVLTTGNKSEMSTGYATLYGDMAGGFAVLKDVPKTQVYKCCAYRNKKRMVIPERVFVKAPTAELKPGQTDQDTLPPYDVLDGIIRMYVEEDKSPEEISAAGFDAETVKKVIRMVDGAEYKRRQSPPGVKITPKALGRDRRMPITNRYKI